MLRVKVSGALKLRDVGEWEGMEGRVGETISTNLQFAKRAFRIAPVAGII